MELAELIAIASVRSGKTRGVMAKEMGHKSQSRISRLSAGQLVPEASEIVYLAHEAKLPEMQTLAEIEAERHPQFAKMWKAILQQKDKAPMK